MSLTEITTPRGLKRHYASVRARLRDPANAVPDSGFDLKRRRKLQTLFLTGDPIPRMEVAAPTLIRAKGEAFFQSDPFPAWKIVMMGPTAVLSGDPIKPSMNKIMQAVCARFEIAPVDVISHRRDAKVVKPRHIAMYLMRKLTVRSFPEIGKYFGGRDHTTCLFSFRKIEHLVMVDPDMAELVASLTGEIVGVFPAATLYPAGH